MMKGPSCLGANQVKDVPLEVSGLKPNLIVDFERGEPGSDPVSHDLLCQFVHSQGLIYCFLSCSSRTRRWVVSMMFGMACGSYPNMR